MSVGGPYLDAALVEQLKHLSLSSRSVVLGPTVGEHRSPQQGASVEFRQHRPYVPGDEPRRLDWRVLARTNRPYVREYDEETNLRCILMVDSSGSMGYGTDRGGASKFDHAARSAAALAYVLLRGQENVGLAIFARRIGQWLNPRSTARQLSRLIDSLERAGPSGESGIAPAMHEVAERLDRRALIVVLSDLFAPPDALRKGLAHLRHERHEVIVVQVTHPDEETFPFNAWRRFRGLEGEAAYLAEPALIRQRYLAAFKAHRLEIRQSCDALGVRLESFVTNRPVGDSIMEMLRR